MQRRDPRGVDVWPCSECSAGQEQESAQEHLRSPTAAAAFCWSVSRDARSFVCGGRVDRWRTTTSANWTATGEGSAGLEAIPVATTALWTSVAGCAVDDRLRATPSDRTVTACRERGRLGLDCGPSLDRCRGIGLDAHFDRRLCGGIRSLVRRGLGLCWSRHVDSVSAKQALEMALSSLFVWICIPFLLGLTAATLAATALGTVARCTIVCLGLCAASADGSRAVAAVSRSGGIIRSRRAAVVDRFVVDGT